MIRILQRATIRTTPSAATPCRAGGAPDGPLRGLIFAVKDVFDIAGHRTGNGNPVWLETHAPAAHGVGGRAPARGRRATWSAKPTPTSWPTASTARTCITARRPIRARPGRIPGGSSSGSAAAVAGGLVDFALGTDCGGSVRLPASYCGIYGIRTTHGLVPADGVVDLAASFDTVGWFARDAETMRRVGDVHAAGGAGFRAQAPVDRAGRFAFAGADVTRCAAAAVTRLKAERSRIITWSRLFRRSGGMVRNFPHPAG
jgi:amidase